MVSLQSNSHPGNKISPCKYLREGRTIQPRLRDRVVSSVKQISFRMFLTSLSGNGMPSNFFLTFFLATQTLKPDIQKLFAKLYNSSFNRILLSTPFGTSCLCCFRCCCCCCCYSYSKQRGLRCKNKCKL